MFVNFNERAKKEKEKTKATVCRLIHVKPFLNETTTKSDCKKVALELQIILADDLSLNGKYKKKKRCLFLPLRKTTFLSSDVISGAFNMKY